MEIYDASVFIGRFQPVHLGHLKTIRKALKLSKLLIIIIGSHESSPSFQLPWNSEFRIEMIRKCLTSAEKKRVVFLPIRDRIEDVDGWRDEVVQKVLATCREKIQSKPDDNYLVTLIGHNKDASSFYLKIFSQWNFCETGNYKNIHATDFRKVYFSKNQTNYEFIPKKIIPMLEDFKKSDLYKILLARG